MIDRLLPGASRHSTQGHGVDVLSDELRMAIGECEICASGVHGAKLKLAFAAVLAGSHLGIDAGLRAGRTTFPPPNYTALEPIVAPASSSSTAATTAARVCSLCPTEYVINRFTCG